MVRFKSSSKTLTRHRILIAAFYMICSIGSLQMYYVGDSGTSSLPECLSPTVLSKSSSSVTGTGFRIDQIFYLNSFVNPDRNQYMKKWLSSQHIPFTRIESIAGAISPRCWPQSICKKNIRAASTYRYILNYGGVHVSPCLPNEFTTELEGLPFGDRPSYTTGRPFFDLTGTTLVLHSDNVVIPHTDQLEQHLAAAMRSGQIAPEWEVIRLKCCSPNDKSAAAATNPTNGTTTFSVAKIPINLGGKPHDTFFEAMLWKDSALQRLATTLIKVSGERLDRHIASSFQTYTQEVCFCHRQSDSKKQPRVIRGTVLPEESKVSLQRIQQQAPARKGPARKIDRVFYSNLEKNVLRKSMMNFWLNEDPLRTAPYKRISARVGDLSRDQCTEEKNTTQRCRGIVGLARTLLHILDNEPTNGTSLILEDDFFITDPGFQRMEASLAMVPDDWDVIRFDCRDVYQVDLQWLNPFVVRSNQVRERKDCTRCFFCGGTHAMLVREESISRLKSMWGQTPFDDVDCIIGRTEWIKSYCVNIGVGDMFNFFSEGSDIPKTATAAAAASDTVPTPMAAMGARGSDLQSRMKAMFGDRASNRDAAKAVMTELAVNQQAAKAALDRMKKRRTA
jgi:hypothetical protein